MKKIHLFYRHVHIKNDGRSRDPNKRRPEWFSHEKCFKNFMETLDGSPLSQHVTLTIIYDGTETDFVTDFMYPYCAVPRRFPSYVKIVEAGEEVKSWLLALSIVRSTEMADDDFIYFVENDYLHVHGWMEKVAELFASNIPCDYISLYDHMDKYIYSMYDDLTAKLFVTGSHHWRTAPSTCGTFMLSRKTFLEDLDVWSRTTMGEYHKFSELCNDRKRVVLTPVPGLATHCMAGYLSPTVDWVAL